MEREILRLVSIIGYSATVAQNFGVFPLSLPTLVTDRVRAGDQIWISSLTELTERYPHLVEELSDIGVNAVAVVPMSTAPGPGAVCVGFDAPVELPGEAGEFIQAVVGQAEQALQRAAIADRRREAADTLQRALLPGVPPAVDHLVVATRYLPAVHDVRAGGDWYELIPLDAVHTALVIGDVVGQGAQAAAVMGQLRGALAAALLRQDSPATALAHLNRFAARLPGAPASTALCAIVDADARRLTWASAGHPPPLLITAAGADYLDGSGRGPLLGYLPDPDGQLYRDSAVDLEPGSTVLLYTDGLVERRGETIDTGMHRVAAAAGPLLDAGPERLVSELVAAAELGGGNHDDVAVLAARLLPDPLRGRTGARPEELAGIRREARRWAALAALDPDHTYDLLLTLEETTANAAEHAYRDRPPGPLEYDLTRHRDTTVSVEVRDFGSWRPPATDPGHRGRGLNLIQHLAPDLTVVQRPEGGTTVRFTLAPPEPECATPSA